MPYRLAKCNRACSWHASTSSHAGFRLAVPVASPPTKAFPAAHLVGTPGVLALARLAALAVMRFLPPLAVLAAPLPVVAGAAQRPPNGSPPGLLAARRPPRDVLPDEPGRRRLKLLRRRPVRASRRSSSSRRPVSAGGRRDAEGDDRWQQLRHFSICPEPPICITAPIRVCFCVVCVSLSFLRFQCSGECAWADFFLHLPFDCLAGASNVMYLLLTYDVCLKSEPPGRWPGRLSERLISWRELCSYEGIRRMLYYDT